MKITQKNDATIALVHAEQKLNQPDIVIDISRSPMLDNLHTVTPSTEQRTRLSPWQSCLCGSIGVAIAAVPLIFLFYNIFGNDNSGADLRGFTRPEDSTAPYILP